MKAILLLAMFLSVGGSFAQVLRQNKVNVYTLLVDYNNPQFQGGNLAYYDCPSCTNDSLPFLVDYVEPNDFGSMTFLLNPTEDTLFNGSISWMGQGQISYPYTFSMQSPFTVQDDIIGMPENVSCYDMTGHKITDPQFMNAAQNAWYEVNQLEVVELAAESGFRTAMYLYAPTVGSFDPDAAKWVIFMYRNVQVNEMTEVSSGEEYALYPNPAKDIIHIKGDDQKISRYEVRNNLGQLLQSGNLDSHSILLTGMSDGIYFLDLRDDDKLVQRIRFQKF